MAGSKMVIVFDFYRTLIEDDIDRWVVENMDGEGRLRIFPYHDLVLFHGCNLCPPNLCKGHVIEQIQASMSEKGKSRFIYLGDGRGDYRPTLKLDRGDHVMPRKGFLLSVGWPAK
ncbi:hypothetical protein RND71_038283 [Anisodus tanguticus]|uniref:Uncharacterized protein n=1 Tax=Anisodus tanguticus TaxID=243964 RepID=A0AAE1R2D0_9SOLA|nr:hypothetical protein RND71_038283 [Anisodus tanguticus]